MNPDIFTAGASTVPATSVATQAPTTAPATPVIPAFQAKQRFQRAPKKQPVTPAVQTAFVKR